MNYCTKHTQELLQELEVNNGFVDKYDDIFCGTTYLNVVKKGKITTNDMLLIFLIDGAQLFESKESNCWIYHRSYLTSPLTTTTR